MIKLSKQTVRILAAHGDIIAKYHLGLNRFLHQRGGFVTNDGLSNMRIARNEAKMNSFGYPPIKKSNAPLKLVVDSDGSCYKL